MARVKPFKCIRPREDIAKRVAALPYDVCNRTEACEIVAKEEFSFLKIDRAETSLDDSIDTYDLRVYAKAKELLEEMIAKEVLISDEEETYYLYELTMNGRAQTGIVACSSIDDYLNSVIKKHENTREDKEQDRIMHVDTCNAHTGPIFLAYRAKNTINAIVENEKLKKPLYDFIAEDGVGHRVWKIDSHDIIETLKQELSSIEHIYIADGHHRAASAVKVGLKRRAENPGFTGEEEFNYFLSVLFPDDQLEILDYNRVVKDLNGLSSEEFLASIQKDFIVEQVGSTPVKPEIKGTIGMLLDQCWYKLSAKQHILSEDPVDGLDVALLQNYILTPILGIKDPRVDKRIDFVGGIRGLKELEKRCNEDMKVAFAMYPTQIGELFAVSDADKLMPPKSTWFEPKLRSGLFIHQL